MPYHPQCLRAYIKLALGDKNLKVPGSFLHDKARGKKVSWSDILEFDSD